MPSKTTLKFPLKLKKIHATGFLSETEQSKSSSLLLINEDESNK